jgi:polyhydroxyalkanoate synthesis regulator phasin
MTDDSRHDRDSDPIRDGIRTVTGVLGALKDAIEDTFDELRERGELSPERARAAARSTMKKAQESFDDMRDRVDFVSRREFDELRAEVDSLRARLDAHTGTTDTSGMGDGGGTAGPPPGGSPPDDGNDRTFRVEGA